MELQGDPEGCGLLQKAAVEGYSQQHVTLLHLRKELTAAAVAVDVGVVR